MSGGPLLAALAFMSFGFFEILLVGMVALLVFGGDLADVMRSLGRSYGKLRRSLHEFSRPVREEFRQVRDLPPPTAPAPEAREEALGEGSGDEAPREHEEEQGARPEVGAADEPPPV